MSGRILQDCLQSPDLYLPPPLALLSTRWTNTIRGPTTQNPIPPGESVDRWDPHTSASWFACCPSGAYVQSGEGGKPDEFCVYCISAISVLWIRIHQPMGGVGKAALASFLSDSLAASKCQPYDCSRSIFPDHLSQWYGQWTWRHEVQDV